MLICIYIILLCASLMFSKIITKSWLSIASIFSVIWILTAVFAIKNNLNIAIPSFQIHIYIISSIIIYNLIFLIFSKKNSGENKRKYVLNYRAIYICNIISIFLMMPHIITAFQVILDSGFSNVRDVVYVGINNGPAYYAVLTRTLPFSIIGVTSLICSLEMVKGKFRLLFITIIGVFIVTITFGGRFAVFNFIIFYLIGFLFTEKNIRKRIKFKYIIFSITILSVITYLRSSNNIGVYDMVVLYFSGALSYLETILNHKELFGIGEGFRTYNGFLTFGFVIEPITLVLKIVGFDLDVPSFIFNSYAQGWTNIGRDGNVLWYNNNTTMFYTFYLDFGKYGPYIGSVIISIFGVYLYNKFYETKSYLFFCILIYYVANLISTPITYDFTSLTTLLSIIFIILFLEKEN